MNGGLAMKKRSSVKQIVAALKQAELGLTGVDLIRKVGITKQTFESSMFNLRED